MSAETQIGQPPAPALNARVTAPTIPTAPAPEPARPSVVPVSANPEPGTPAPPPITPPPLGFQLQIDPETQRLIIEVREPVTGFIVFQSPPKTAFSSTGASSAGSTRGKSLDRDI